MMDVRTVLRQTRDYAMGVDSGVKEIQAIIDKAVAEAEARMREHYRPAIDAWAFECARYRRMHPFEEMAAYRTQLGLRGITGPLADECIAAAEAES